LQVSLYALSLGKVDRLVKKSEMKPFYKRVLYLGFVVTSQYVPVGPLRHPLIFFNTAKTCR